MDGGAVHCANQPIARIAASARRRLMQDGLRTCSRSVTSARHPRRTERRNRSIYIIYEDSCYLPTQAHWRATQRNIAALHHFRHAIRSYVERSVQWFAPVRTLEKLVEVDSAIDLTN